MKYLAMLSFLGFLVSCTLSFQNIDTHGTATDLVDDTQTPEVTASATVPVSALPAFPGISK